MFLRSFSGASIEIWFLAKSNDARLLHLSRPVRSLICMPAPLMVERLDTSASVIGLLLSRFSKTTFRTAASRFLSGKMETSTLLVAVSVLLVFASAAPARGSTERQIPVKETMMDRLFIANDYRLVESLKSRRSRSQKHSRWTILASRPKGSIFVGQLEGPAQSARRSPFKLVADSPV